MAARQYSWPAGHWSWPIPVTHKHGVRCRDMIFIGGQVDVDAAGNVRNPDDLAVQARAAMQYIRAVLEDLGADTADLVKLICFYVQRDERDTERLLAAVAGALDAQPGPVISLLPLPALAYEHMVVEIEAVAMRRPDGARMARTVSTAGTPGTLPAPFSHALSCGRMRFIGGQTALDANGAVLAGGDLIGQCGLLMERIGALLGDLGADYQDVVKINRYYVAGGTADQWEGAALACARYFEEPGPAATGIPVPALFRPGLMISLEVTAMRDEHGGKMPRAHVWPEGHWDWPVHLPYKHGIKCGNMIYIGGQVSMDAGGRILDPGEIVLQTRTSMANIARVLAGFGARLDDVVKVTTFYAGTASAEALHQNLRIRSASFTEPGPATTGVPLPCLAYERMEIEIEVVAMLD
ncbi:MAG: RidA family protein [Candidatus Binatia bacterium]